MNALLEKYNASAIRDMFSDAQKQSANGDLVRIAAITPGGVWLVGTMDGGKFKSAEHSNTTEKISGMTIRCAKSANFMGMLDDGDVSGKYMGDEEYNKYTRNSTVGDMVQRAKNGGFGIVLADDSGKIHGGVFLKRQAFEKVQKFFQTQQQRKDAEDNGSQQKTLKRQFTADAINKMQREFLKKHPHDDLDKITGFVKALTKNGWLNDDIRQFQGFGDDFKGPWAKVGAQQNIIGFMLAYCSADDREKYRKEGQNPTGVVGTQLISKRRDDLFKWCDRNIASDKGDGSSSANESLSIMQILSKGNMNMNKNQKKALYESIMSKVSKEVRNALSEDSFQTPEKTWKEKLFRQEASYDARCKAAEDEYYRDHAEKYINMLRRAAGMQDLLNVSIAMTRDGFKFPVSGMLADGANAGTARLHDIIWQTYDMDSSFRADTLAKIEEKQPVNDVAVYTYYYSWRWWTANIVRCLVFPRDPYGSEADSNVKEYIRDYAPKCPIINVYPDYFKH